VTLKCLDKFNDVSLGIVYNRNLHHGSRAVYLVGRVNNASAGSLGGGRNANNIRCEEYDHGFTNGYLVPTCIAEQDKRGLRPVPREDNIGNSLPPEFRVNSRHFFETEYRFVKTDSAFQITHDELGEDVVRLQVAHVLLLPAI
jgi:hypothetical protein